MSDFFDEYNEDWEDYTPDAYDEFLSPSVGEVLKILIWTTFLVIGIVCAFINLI